MPKKPQVPPDLLHVDRTLYILEGVVQSRSDPDRQYHPRVLLEANFLDTCDGSIMRDSICQHLRVLLESLDKAELIQWIIDSQKQPDPIVPEEG